MRLVVVGKHVKIDDDVRERVRRRIGFGLDRFGTVVEAVRVSVEDVNGPKGGIDKRCVVEVEGARLGRLRVEVQGSDSLETIDRGIDRVARSISRSLRRRRAQERSGVVNFEGGS
jgi:ribosome-associated translation inhibitor RaiA